MKILTVPYFINTNKSNTTDEISTLLDLIPKEKIANVSWPDYAYKPDVGFAMAYGSDCFFVKFYVSEQDLRAVYNNINDPVHKDSCVEFFIAFDDDDEYYNLEFNSIGACFAGFGKGREERTLLPVSVIKRIRHQTFVNSNNENDLISWQLTLVIPFDVFCYHDINEFNIKNCRVNFYKCGDDLPEPHFLSWNKIYSDTPDFHLPQFFGNIQFV
ncbi:carbohydrate-binding family 9-like protein [Mucilaginibacter sp. AW1-3]